MSNELTYRAFVHLKPGSSIDDFESEFDAAMKRKNVDVALDEMEALDPRIPESIYLQIETYGTGGHTDDRQEAVLQFLNEVSAIGGIMEVCDQDMSSSAEESIILHAFGPTPKHREFARVVNAIDEFKDSVGGLLDPAQLERILAIASENYPQEVDDVRQYHALTNPQSTPKM